MAERIVGLLEDVYLREKNLSKVKYHLSEVEKILIKRKGRPDEPGNTTDEDSDEEEEWQDVEEAVPVVSGSRQAGVVQWGNVEEAAPAVLGSRQGRVLAGQCDYVEVDRQRGNVVEAIPVTPGSTRVEIQDRQRNGVEASGPVPSGTRNTQSGMQGMHPPNYLGVQDGRPMNYLGHFDFERR